VLGPSNVRDAIGLVPDSYANPISYVKPVRARYILYGAYLIDRRASLLDATDLIDQAALDRYQFTRDAYIRTAPAWNTRAIRRLRRSRTTAAKPAPGGRSQDEAGRTAARESALKWRNSHCGLGESRCVGRNWRG